ILPVDLNGDGRDDLVCLIPTGVLSNFSHYAFLISNGYDFGHLQRTSWRALGLPRPIDFDMDGRIELLMYDEGKVLARGDDRTVLNRVVVDTTTRLVTLEEVATFPPGQYLAVDFVGNRLAD